MLWSAALDPAAAPDVPRAYPVTAYSIVNALGCRREDVADALDRGRSGLTTDRAPFELPFETALGVVSPEALAQAPADGVDTRATRLATALLPEVRAALARAIARWGADRVALLLGTTTAGVGATEAAYAHHVAHGTLPTGYDFYVHHGYESVVTTLRAATGVAGPGLVLSTACSSSVKILGTAQRLLDAGVVDAVLAGGVDTLTETTVRGFHSLGVLSDSPCRPFSSARKGISIGEGGALLLLEREGDGPAWLLGVGETSDAHHMSAPHPEGAGARAAMSGALDRAGLDAGAVDHVNAHGTGTRLNDHAEALAIASVFGTSVPVASTKGYTGHLLGAAGATEAALSILAIERGRVPRSLGADPLDPDIGVNVAGPSPPGADGACRVVLTNAFAFGGNNVSAIFGATP